jgi:hypothetical protein
MFFASILVLLSCLLAMSLSIKPEGYLAPLAGMDNRDKYPGEYLITLYNNHTLEQHFDAVGHNLSRLPGFRKYGFGYSAIMDEKMRDKQVRRDPGVRMVEAEAPIYGWDDVVSFELLELPDNQD